MRSDVRTYAHNLNGVLSTILATADLAAQRNGDGDQTKAAFASIVRDAKRAGTLVETLSKTASADEAGGDSTHERDLDYLDRVHGEPDALIAELERRGQDRDIPIVDRETGRLLSVLVAAMQPKEILEIGTAYGYSTLWMARALGPGGHILTIDPDKERTDIASSFFERAGVADRIEIRNQPALDVLPRLPKGRFDVIFIDALKEEYSDYLRLGLPLLRSHGLVLADNVLWAHAASKPPSADDPQSTKAIRRFNEELLSYPELLGTIIPIGDGLGIATKIS